MIKRLHWVLPAFWVEKIFEMVKSYRKKATTYEIKKNDLPSIDMKIKTGHVKDEPSFMKGATALSNPSPNFEKNTYVPTYSRPMGYIMTSIYIEHVDLMFMGMSKISGLPVYGYIGNDFKSLEAYLTSIYVQYSEILDTGTVQRN